MLQEIKYYKYKENKNFLQINNEIAWKISKFYKYIAIIEYEAKEDW